MSTPQKHENSQETPTLPGKKFSLDILAVVKSSQLKYGLRHSDYQRYRHYCTRRLARLRKGLGFTHDIKGGKKYNPRPISAATITNADFLLLVLMKAERSWSYAMQLKQDMEIQTKNTRLRHHLVRRLDKACKYADLLEKLCTATADERTALEAEAYFASLTGQVTLEREQWKHALESLLKARAIYDKLGAVADFDTRELCKQRVEELDPSIRYCNYNLKKEKGGAAAAKDDDTHKLIEVMLKSNELLSTKLDTVLNDARQQTGGEVKEVSWKGRNLPVRSEKLHNLLLSASGIVAELEEKSASGNEETQMPLYDKLYAAYSDAQQVIKDELAALRKDAGKSKTGKIDSSEQNLIYLQEYVNFLKISATVQRSLAIAEGSAAAADRADTKTEGKKRRLKPDDFVRLYDGILSNINELREVASAAAEGDENRDKLADLEAQTLIYKGYRCYWLAHSFSIAGKGQESLALFDRALSHSSVARSKCSKLKQAGEHIRRLDELDKLIKGQRSKAHAKAFLTHIKNQEALTKGISSLSLSSSSDQLPPAPHALAQGLDEYTPAFFSEKRLIDLPPDFEPIACKPLLFDTAFNGVEFPDLEARKKSQKGGLFGWFGR